MRFRILRIGKSFKIQRRFWFGWCTVDEAFNDERYARELLKGRIDRLQDKKQRHGGVVVYSTRLWS